MRETSTDPVATLTTRWNRRRRPITRWVGIVVAALVVLHILGGWYFAGQINSSGLEPDPAEPDFMIPLLEVGAGTILLDTTEGPDELELAAVWGLEWSTGYGQLQALRATYDDSVEWELEVLTGEPPTAGGFAHHDVRAFPDDPAAAHGLSFEEVGFTSELGPIPAWLIPGTDPTWVILVHGNGLTRRDVLKPLPVIAEARHPALAITYRNHPEALPDPSGRLQYGLTEWRDLEGAVRYALDNGAEDVVLVGYSMGGGIVVNFMYESSLASAVRGLILDAPMLDFSAAVDLGARNRSLPLIGLPIPDTLTSTAKWMAGVRFDVPWGDLDYLERAGELEVPILLFHGAEDDIVPVSTSDELAALRPELVTYFLVDDAPHIGTWNLDPERYEQVFGNFLAGL